VNWWGFLRACVVLSTLLAPAATVSAEGGPFSPQALGIDREVQFLESQLGSLTAATRLFTMGQESGVLTLYPTVEGKTKLVVQFVSGETGRVSEFYFRDKSLFYAIDACRSFGLPSSQASAGKCSTLTENRYYFSGEKLVCWLTGQGENGFELREASAEPTKLASTGNTLAERAARWLAFARSPIAAPGETQLPEAALE